MVSKYELQSLRVDPNPQHPNGWAEFVGKEVGRIPGILDQSEKETRHGFFTLYETPDEGYRLYAVESTIEASDDVRREGRRAVGGATSRALYSEEEARRKYPELFDRLLNTAED
jgi:hypothetical protein